MRKFILSINYISNNRSGHNQQLYFQSRNNWQRHHFAIFCVACCSADHVATFYSVNGFRPATLIFSVILLIACAELPFGQVPLLRIDGLNIVQSGAIIRHVARKAKLLGDTDLESTR